MSPRSQEDIFHWHDISHVMFLIVFSFTTVLVLPFAFTGFAPLDDDPLVAHASLVSGQPSIWNVQLAVW